MSDAGALLKRHPIVSLHFRSASRQLASGCKDTRRGTIPRRVDVAGPGIGRVSSKAPSSSSSADPRPRRGGFTFPRWTRSRRRRGGFGRHGRSSSAPAALYLRTHSSGVRGRGGHVAARPPRRVPFRCSKTLEARENQGGRQIKRHSGRRRTRAGAGRAFGHAAPAAGRG